MNDRYLYRAKRMDNGEWVGGNLIWNNDFCDNSKAIIIPITRNNLFTRGGENGHLVSKDWCRVDPSSICQCTGRNDEWEHDIFQCDDERYEIQFSEDSLTWEAVSIFSPESISLGEFNPSEYVRIGNAIDNPELLEVGE
ncbi:MAG: hypothetical protein MSA09_03510 [Lachnospiraceae bacterium]|nr:hypothetical protein [Lachnospiraceae bacterium]